MLPQESQFAPRISVAFPKNLLYITNFVFSHKPGHFGTCKHFPKKVGWQFTLFTLLFISQTFWTGMRWQFIAIVRAARFVKLSLEIQPTNVVKGHSICVFLYTRQLMQQLPSQLNEYSTIFYPVSKTPLPFCPENLKIFPKNLKTFPKNLKTFPKSLQTP